MTRTARLFADFGIVRDDRIVICSASELDVIVLYLAAMRLGVTPALIDPQCSLDEALVLIRAARARALFVDARLADAPQLDEALLSGGRTIRVCGGASTATGASAPCVPDASCFPAVMDRLEPLEPLPVSLPDSTSAFILFTSGTTSRPKGVEASLGAVTAHMATMHRQYGYDEHSVVLNGLPLHHSDGINHGPVNIMAAGGTVYRTGTFSVQQLPHILQMIATRGITHMITVPTVLALIERLGDGHADAFRTPSFRFVSSTAGPLDEGLWRRFEERFGTMVVNSYGLTETICEGFYCGPDPQTRRIGTIGKPVDIEARIVTAEGADAGPNQMGELLLRGSCVMKGYFDAPEETAAVLRDGWLYTGDLALRDADGFYTITGRKKNVIISGGINVYPEDVSRAIARMPGIVDAVTLGVADETWGERVVSCVVTARPGAPTAEQVIEHCRAHMAREKVPSQVLILEQLPRGPSGKVALPEVRSLVAARLAAAEAQVSDAIAWSPEQVSERVMQLAAQSFKTTLSELTLDSEAESTPGWSSLAHMDFLLGIESTFGLKLSPADMLSIISLGDAIDLVLEVVARRASR
jgi:long-chain acyl-CoA synthetase